MTDWTLRIVLTLVIGGASLLLIDAIGANCRATTPASGVVVDRQYQCGQVWTSYDGKRTSVHSSPDEWRVIVRDDDGQIIVEHASIGMWASCPAGTRVDLARHTGPMGLVHYTSLIGPALVVEPRATWNH